MKRYLAAAILAVTSTAAQAGEADPAQQGSPRLIVAVSVDQFSSGLYEAWRSRFTGGLARLSQGVVYPNAYQAHASTETCPGHSTLLSGRHPNKTGLIANMVRDPASGREVYCLYDPSVVFAHGGSAPPVGPQRMMVDTFGDWLKAASPKSRVFGVSAKDRGAITMAGRGADGVFWLAEGFGFTTYLAPGGDAKAALAPVAELNARLAPVWTRRPHWPLVHAECRGLDSKWDVAGRPFESRLPPTGFGQSDDPKRIARDVMTSPIMDDLTLDAARHLIRSQRLGQGPAVDLLTISFSATDLIGHAYGTKGPEMCEQMHALDQRLARLLEDLDGLKIPYLVVLSADHGGSDLAERLRTEGYPADRVDGRAILQRVNQRLIAELSLTAPPLVGSVERPTLAPTVPAADRARVAAAAARELANQPEIAAAFTLDELLAVQVPPGKPADELTLQERFALSAYTGRSGDVLAALQPYTSAGPAIPGAYISGHGSPWNYDRKVPVLFWWNQAPRATRSLPIMTVDIAPTLAAAVGIQAPADVDGRCWPLADFGQGVCQD